MNFSSRFSKMTGYCVSPRFRSLIFYHVIKYYSDEIYLDCKFGFLPIRIFRNMIFWALLSSTAIHMFFLVLMTWAFYNLCNISTTQKTLSFLSKLWISWAPWFSLLWLKWPLTIIVAVFFIGKCNWEKIDASVLSRKTAVLCANGFCRFYFLRMIYCVIKCHERNNFLSCTQCTCYVVDHCLNCDLVSMLKPLRVPKCVHCLFLFALVLGRM